MAFILTTPNSATDTSSTSSTGDGIIPNNSTVTVDSVELVEANTIKWIVELIDVNNQKIKSFEILAINKFNVNVSFNKYSILGDNILHDVSITINGNRIDLNITNNEPVDLNYKFTSTQL